MSSTNLVIDNVTCLACGCLCDDIRIEVDNGRITEAHRACAIGRPWFVFEVADTAPPFTIEGQEVSLEDALDRAAEILRNAQAPIIWGLTETTVEAVASAITLADRIGAVVDLAGGHEAASKLEAFQRVGQVSASLGEVKDRADLVVFWGCDPLTTHPRHWEHYSVDPRGRFIPDGRAGRFVIVVDAEPTATSRSADLFIQVERECQTEVLRLLRSLAQGIVIDPDRAERVTGITFENLQLLDEKLRSARYGAVFLETRPGTGAEGRRAYEAALSLVRDLNEARRFVALELGGPGNPTGATAALAWQTGAGSAVDFAAGYPRHLPGEATAKSRLEMGQVDAILIVGEPDPKLVQTALDCGIATIVIGSNSKTMRFGRVTIEVARPGIASGGTVARVDGVMLPLRPALSSKLPSARQVIDAIGERCKNRQ